jgi:DNA segregation ATPase FtsK/SpoIIIE-like protein
VIGATVNDTGQTRVVTGDMARLVHVAIGGSAGWGKSVFMQTLAYQLVMAQERPNLAMVDLDGTTLSPFANCDRLLYPLADSQADALAVFTALADELERRKALFDQVPGAVDLASYNRLADDPLPATVLLCDEATALLGDKSVEAAIRRLALRGRKFGLWCVLAGQDWKASSLDSAIKNQLSTRVQFKANSPAQSRVLLEQRGAESLPVPGRALAILPGQEVQEVQAAQVSYSDITTALAGQRGPQASPPAVEADVVTAATTSGLTTQEVETVRDLWAQGKSYSAIADVVFSDRGGRNSRRVEMIRQAVESGDW